MTIKRSIENKMTELETVTDLCRTVDNHCIAALEF